MKTITEIGVIADPYGHMWGNDEGWMWLWGTLMMLAIIGAIVAGIWLIVRSTRPPGPRPNDRAREILAERYARGDLSSEEYHERLAELT